MRLLIGLDDALDADVDRFIEDWNSDERCVDVGIAGPGPVLDTLDITLIEAVLVVIEALAIGLTTNAVYDLVIGKLRRSPTETTYEEMTLPDGTRYVRVVVTDD